MRILFWTIFRAPVFALSLFLASVAFAGEAPDTGVADVAAGDAQESIELLPLIDGVPLAAVAHPSCEENVQGRNRIGACCNQPVAILEKIRARNSKSDTPPFESVYHCQDRRQGKASPLSFCSVNRKDQFCRKMDLPHAKQAVDYAYSDTRRIDVSSGKANIEGPDVYSGDIEQSLKWQSENRYALRYFSTVLGIKEISVSQYLQVDRELGLTLPLSTSAYGLLDTPGPADKEYCPGGGRDGECRYPVHGCVLPALQLVYSLESYFKAANIPGIESVGVSIESCSDANRIDAFAKRLLEVDSSGRSLLDALRDFVATYQISYLLLRESLDLSKNRNTYEIFGWDPSEQSSYTIKIGRPDMVREATDVISSLIFGDEEADPAFDRDGLKLFIERGMEMNPENRSTLP